MRPNASARSLPIANRFYPGNDSGDKALIGVDDSKYPQPLLQRARIIRNRSIDLASSPGSVRRVKSFFREPIRLDSTFN
jgi:hypothetical protein